MPRKKNNPGYVTMAECTRISSGINAELITIKKALVGTDLRGGVVKDVADIKSSQEAMQKDIGRLRNSNGLGGKERAMIYGATISAFTLIVVEVIRFLGTISG